MNWKLGKALLVAPALVLSGASSVSALDCIEVEFNTERLSLELESVTVDGAPAAETTAYEGFSVTVKNEPNYDGTSSGLLFQATENDTDDDEFNPGYFERFDVE